MESEDVTVRLVVPATPAPVATPGVPATTGAPELNRTGLPLTGAELLTVLVLAVVLLVLGAVLLKAGRAPHRRPTSPTRP